MIVRGSRRTRIYVIDVRNISLFLQFNKVNCASSPSPVNKCWNVIVWDQDFFVGFISFIEKMLNVFINGTNGTGDEWINIILVERASEASD